MDKVPTIPKNSEDETMAEDLEDFDQMLSDSSVKAKQMNPYGPAFPELDRIFKTGR